MHRQRVRYIAFSFVIIVLISFPYICRAYAIDERPEFDWIFPPLDANLDWNMNISTLGIEFSDFNGDNFDDLAVGYAGLDFQSRTVKYNAGTVLLFYSDGSSLPIEPTTYITRYDSISFGRYLYRVGDVNGDIFDDLLVYDPWWKSLFPATMGRFLLFLGGYRGLSNTPVEILSGDDNIRFNHVEDGFSIIATDIDVNGDRVNDIIIQGTPLAMDGSVEVLAYYGNKDEFVFSDPGWTYIYEDTDHVRIVSVGDVNGDGFDDISIINSSYIDFFYGGKSGLGTIPTTTISDNVPYGDWYYFERAGDINGDGFDDIIGKIYDEMRFVFFFGSAAGITPTPDCDFILLGNNTAFVMFSGIGDVDGDGFDDIIISHYTADTNTVQIRFGSSSCISNEYWKYFPADFSFDTALIGGAISHGSGNIRGDSGSDFAIEVISGLSWPTYYYSHTAAIYSTIDSPTSTLPSTSTTTSNPSTTTTHASTSTTASSTTTTAYNSENDGISDNSNKDETACCGC
ncbi:VCBS repeat-containing protein [bacterium]|nr:VCBS repeat-containing protein [bacterium]